MIAAGRGVYSAVLQVPMFSVFSVDYIHTETSATPLMIAAGRGVYSAVEQLLSLGANINIRASNEWTALDWARRFERNDIIELLEAHS